MKIPDSEPKSIQLKQLLIVLSTLTVNLLIDRITKILAESYLPGRGVVPVISDYVILVYAKNSGAFLSLGAQWPQSIKGILLLGLPAILCIGVTIWCITNKQATGKIIIIMTITAGGFGNIIDRAMNDFMVTDFLNFGIGNLRTGVLNVADLSVTFGAIAYAIYALRLSNRETKKDITS